MLNLLLARHGQSEWNAAGRWQGQADPPLTELGLAQARSAAGHAGSFDAVFASDLERACVTAQIIAEGIGIGPVIIDPRLRERHAGEYEGLTRAEIDERYPGAIEAERWPPGWESNAEIQTRLLEALNDIIDYTGGDGDVLVVCHGGVIYALEHLWEGAHTRITNLGGRWVHHNGSEWTLGERVQLSGDDVSVEAQDLL
jgi:broad specificity phosphatase PhoE